MTLTDRMRKRFEARPKAEPEEVYDVGFPGNSRFAKGTGIYNPRLNDIRILNREMTFSDIKFSDTDEHPIYSSGEIWRQEDQLKMVVINNEEFKVT